MNKDSHLIFETYLNEQSAPLEMHRVLVDKLLDKIEAEESSVRLMQLIGIRAATGSGVYGAPSGSLKGRLQRVLGTIKRDYQMPEIYKKYEDLYGINVEDRAKQLLQINPNHDPKKDGPLDPRLDKLFDEDPRSKAIENAQVWLNDVQKELTDSPVTAFLAAAEPERKQDLIEYLKDGIDFIFSIPNIGKIDPNDPSNDPNQGQY